MRTVSRLLASAAIPCVMNSAVYGQVEMSGQAAEAAADDVLIVTAQRREQAIDDVAAVVQVIKGDQLETRGISEFNNLGRLTPNLTIEGSYGNAGNPIISIRGVGLSDFNDNNNSPAGVYVDGVYYVSPAMLGFGLFDVERVEVLKGPQGTLYGRNTTAGAINFISRRPTDELEGYVQGTYETFEHYKLEAALSGPVTDTLAMRVSGLYDQGGDYIENRLTGEDNGGRDLLAGRFLTSWTPTDEFSVLFNVHGARDHSDIGQYEQAPLLDPLTGGFCEAAILGIPDPSQCTDTLDYSDTDDDVYAGEYDTRGQLDYDSFGSSAEINWELGRGLTLTSISAYEGFEGTRLEDTDASPNAFVEVLFDIDVKQWSQELRLSGRAGPLDWVAGGYFASDEIVANNTYDIGRELRPLLGFDGENVFVAVNDYDQDTDVAAFFAHGFWSIGQRWILETGLRWSDEQRDFSTISSFDEDPAILDAIGLGPEGVFMDESQEFDTQNTLWTLGLSFEPTRETLVYAKASNGFKAGGFNGGIPLSADEVVPYDDESLLAYELGVKGRSPWGNLRYEAAAFYYDYTDLQVFTLADTGGGVPVQVLTNAADSEIFGLDFSLIGPITDNLDARLGIGLLEAEYIDANVGGLDVSGQTLENAPGFSMVAGLDYRRRLRSVQLTSSFDAAYQSEELLEVFELEPGRRTELTEDGYWLVDARIGLGDPNDRWELAVYAKNLLDENALTGTLTFPDFGLGQYTYTFPRRVGVQLRSSF